MLVLEVDVVVVDVTEVGESLVWELEICRREGALAKTAYVAAEGAVRDPRVEDLIGSSRVFGYTAEGITDSGAFRRHVADLLTGG